MTKYKAAWEAYKSTEEYRSSINAMAAKGMKQPYMDNIIQAAFSANWKEEEPEILNIEYHTKRLMIKAMNLGKTHADAYNLLRISERTFFRWKKEFGITKHPVTGLYYSKRSDEHYLKN